MVDIASDVRGRSWLTILHAGETGVERGAYIAAIAEGIPIAGVMRSDRRDEYGPLSGEIARSLAVSIDRGPRAAALATLAIADALLLVVPNADEEMPSHLLWLLTAARGRRIPWMVADAMTTAEVLTGWLHKLRETAENVSLYVTGPRETRWAAGKTASRRLVGGIVTRSQLA